MLTVNLEQEETFEWPVKVDVPEKGRHITKTFTGVFLLIEQDELNELIGLNRATSNGEDDDQDQDNPDLVERVFVGWGEDLRDGNKEPIPFSEELKEILIKKIIFRRGITKAFFEGAGGKQAKVGNSKK
jgi:hypothetical protein